MNRYIVYYSNDDDKIESEFGSANFEIAPSLWVIGTEIPTSVDVCKRLGIEDGLSMVVIPVNDYYGLWDRALWQKLDAWAKP